MSLEQPLPATLPADATMTFETWLEDLPGATSLDYPEHDGSTVAPAGLFPGMTPGEGDPATGRYVLQREVARGGMGEVWEAVQAPLHRKVAVKRLQARLLEGQLGLVRMHEFRQEALVAAQLEHPNIVPVHDFARDAQGRPMLAMKMVRGGSWSDMIKADLPAMAPREFLARHLPILASVAQAVAFAHSRGVVHRDLKPEQVMTGEFGEVLLMDWGLALLVEQQGEDSRELPPGLPTRETATSPSGTPAYMAPEQTLDTADGIGTWTDVYLLGGTLYYLLTGTRPHGGQTVQEVYAKARLGDVEPPANRSPGRWMPEEMARLAREALSPEPAERVASAAAFIVRLADYLSGATKRAESEAILASVAADMEGAPKASYQRCGDWILRLREAERAWPENPRLVTLVARAREQHCEAAIATGDLALARLQAGEVEVAGKREELLLRVDEREAAARRRERERVLGRWALVGLLAVMLAGAAAFSYRLDQKNQRVEAARDDALDVVNYLLTDLRDRMTGTEQETALLGVGQRVLGYLASIPPDEATPASDFQRARALREVARVHYSVGDAATALELCDESLAITGQHAGEDGGGLDWARSRAFTQALRAACLDALGRAAEALASREAALAEADRCIAALPEDLPSLGPGEALSWARFLWLLREARPGDFEWKLELVESMGMLGEFLYQMDEGRSEIEVRLHALELARDLHRMAPTNPEAIHQLADKTLKAAMLWGPPSLVPDDGPLYREAQALTSELHGLDPKNVEWLALHVMATSGLGRNLYAKSELEEAEPLLEESVRLARQLLDLAPDNQRYTHHYRVAIGLHAVLLREFQEYGRAADLLLESIELAEQEEPGSTSAFAHIELAVTLGQAGRHEEASTQMARGLDDDETLEAARRGDRTAFDDLSYRFARAAEYYTSVGRHGEAEKQYRALAGLLPGVRDSYKDVTALRQEELFVHWMLGDTLLAQERWEEALEAFERALVNMPSTREANRADAEWLRDLAVLEASTARCLARLGQRDRAARHYDDAVALLRESSVIADEWTIGSVQELLGELLVERGALGP